MSNAEGPLDRPPVPPRPEPAPQPPRQAPDRPITRPDRSSRPTGTPEPTTPATAEFVRTRRPARSQAPPDATPPQHTPAESTSTPPKQAREPAPKSSDSAASDPKRKDENKQRETRPDTTPTPAKPDAASNDTKKPETKPTSQVSATVGAAAVSKQVDKQATESTDTNKPTEPTNDKQKAQPDTPPDTPTIYVVKEAPEPVRIRKTYSGTTEDISPAGKALLGAALLVTGALNDLLGDGKEPKDTDKPDTPAKQPPTPDEANQTKPVGPVPTPPGEAPETTPPTPEPTTGVHIAHGKDTQSVPHEMSRPEAANDQKIVYIDHRKSDGEVPRAKDVQDTRFDVTAGVVEGVLEVRRRDGTWREVSDNVRARELNAESSMPLIINAVDAGQVEIFPGYTEHTDGTEIVAKNPLTGGEDAPLSTPDEYTVPTSEGSDISQPSSSDTIGRVPNEAVWTDKTTSETTAPGPQPIDPGSSQGSLTNSAGSNTTPTTETDDDAKMGPWQTKPTSEVNDRPASDTPDTNLGYRDKVGDTLRGRDNDVPAQSRERSNRPRSPRSIAFARRPPRRAKPSKAYYHKRSLRIARAKAIAGDTAALGGGMIGTPRAIAKTRVGEIEHVKGIKGLFKYRAVVTLPDGRQKVITVNAIGRRMARIRLKIRPAADRLFG